MARPEMTTTRSKTTLRERPYTAGAGIGAGIVAALVMGLFMMIVFAARGEGFFTPLQLLGGLFLGEDALAYGLWAALLGLGIHLVAGAFFGVIFAGLAGAIQSYTVRIAAGLAYGAAVFLLMTYLILPWANPLLTRSIDPGWFFLYHLAFGLTLPLALPRRPATPYRGGARTEA